MRLTKLDAYDYMVLPGIIRINVTGSNDPVLVDVLSEISQSNGSIYLDGCYYSYLDDYTLRTNEQGSYMELKVIQTA